MKVEMTSTRTVVVVTRGVTNNERGVEGLETYTLTRPWVYLGEKKSSVDKGTVRIGRKFLIET